MMNRAAKFIGQFSTLDFNTGNYKIAGKNAFKSSRVTFPYTVWGLEYRDELGNITTSKAWRDVNKHKAYAELFPRFGLMGGWNHTWYVPL